MILLASHAKELILKTKLIYINPISPCYFFVISIRLFVIFCCQMSLAMYQHQSGSASSRRKFGNLDKFSLVAFTRITCY